MSPSIFASCRDCPSYLTSAETVLDLLLPAETVVLREIAPCTDCPCDLASCSLGRKQNHMDSLCRKPFFMDRSLGRKQEITDSLGGSQI